jgi:hypothetical protein
MALGELIIYILLTQLIKFVERFKKKIKVDGSTIFF